MIESRVRLHQSRRAHSIDSELRLVTHTESEIASCISISTQEPSEKMISPSNLFSNQASDVTKDYDGEKASSLVTVGITAASALKALELYESEFPRHTGRSMEEYKKTERVLTLALTSSNKEIKRLRSQIQHLSDPKEGQTKQHQKEIAKLEAIVEDQSTELKAKNERVHEVESELLENKIKLSNAEKVSEIMNRENKRLRVQVIALEKEREENQAAISKMESALESQHVAIQQKAEDEDSKREYLNIMGEKNKELEEQLNLVQKQYKEHMEGMKEQWNDLQEMRECQKSQQEARAALVHQLEESKERLQSALNERDELGQKVKHLESQLMESSSTDGIVVSVETREKLENSTKRVFSYVKTLEKALDDKKLKIEMLKQKQKNQELQMQEMNHGMKQMMQRPKSRQEQPKSRKWKARAHDMLKDIERPRFNRRGL